VTPLAEYRDIRLERDGPVAVLTLNRPEVLNACAPETHLEVQDAVQRVEDDAEARVLIIAGAGRAFCSGSDLRVVGKLEGRDARNYLRLDFETKNRIAASQKPVIAALHGHVAGGGFEMALACDIRVAAMDVQFHFAEINIGTIPGAGGLQRLPAIVGLGIAKEWTFTGRRILAEEAHRTGLVNSLHPLPELMPAAMALAREIAKRSPLALHLAKTALDPEPPASRGLVGTYHMLASQACHDDPAYKQGTGGFTARAKG
jgi:enoyl-CoA hydratase/carnithine racemase